MEEILNLCAILIEFTILNQVLIAYAYLKSHYLKDVLRILKSHMEFTPHMHKTVLENIIFYVLKTINRRLFWDTLYILEIRTQILMQLLLFFKNNFV